MNTLISKICLILVAASVVSSRTLSLPDSALKSAGDNVIILDAPVSGEPGSGQKLHLGEDKLVLEGRNFSNLNEMVDILEEDRKEKTSDPQEQTPKPFSIVVPVARRFNSLKELFEIINEGPEAKKPVKSGELVSHSYVKGTEFNPSDYTLFFTS